MVSFPPVSPPRPYTPPSPHPHAQLISFFSILSSAQYWVWSTNNLAPRYAISSIPPLPTTSTGFNNNNNNNNNECRFPVVIGGASGAIPRTATIRPCRGSTQQQETQPVESVSEATLGTTKTGKPRQRVQRSEEMNTFIMGQYYIITKLETIKIGYSRELHDRFTEQFPKMGD